MSDSLSTDLSLRAHHAQGAGIYRIIPAAVGRPSDLGSLRTLLASAARQGLPVTARGAGSAMGGGNIGAGLVLDMTGFDAGRCHLDVSRLQATVSPGLPLAALQATAHPFGVHCPLDPSSARWATIGGLVGTNAAGARTVHDGPMRRWVESLILETDAGPLTLARGVAPDPNHPVVQRWQRDVVPLLSRHREAVLARWPRTRKNTLGYALDAWFATGDLLDLVIGAEGTLGVMTEVTVRVTPIIAHQATLRVTLGERAALPATIACIHRHDPVRLEFLDASFLALVGANLPDASAVLLVDFEDDDPDHLAARLAAATADVVTLGDGVLAVEQASGTAEAHALWAVRHGASPRLAALTDGRRSLQVIEDGCVPPERLAEYLDAVEAACRRRQVDVVLFGHAGDGHVHVNLLPNIETAGWLDHVRAIYEEVSDALLRLGGTPAGEHGAGRLRATLVERFLGAEAVACFRAIRAAFDPSGRFNPGVILPEGDDPFTQLKVGHDAVPLPEGWEEKWRQIEAEARWGAAGDSPSVGRLS